MASIADAHRIMAHAKKQYVTLQQLLLKSMDAVCRKRFTAEMTFWAGVHNRDLATCEHGIEQFRKYVSLRMMDCIAADDSLVMDCHSLVTDSNGKLKSCGSVTQASRSEAYRVLGQNIMQRGNVFQQVVRECCTDGWFV